jgi:ABC-type molybdate transport system, permease component
MTDWLGPEEWQAVALSLRVSFWATILNLPPGILVAFALARWLFPGRHILNGLVHLPLILPPVVTGYILLLALGTNAPAGSAPVPHTRRAIRVSLDGAALAAAVMAFSLMVRAICLSTEAVDP